MEKDLLAEIAEVSWYAAGTNRAVVTVKGKNFFPGTTVLLGDQTYSGPENGLVIKSERTLQLTVPLTALMTDGTLNGRYGPPVQLLPKHPVTKDTIVVDSVALGASTGPLVSLQFLFRVVDQDKGIDWTAFSSMREPLLEVNGTLISSPLRFFRMTDKDDDAKVKRLGFTTFIPAALVPGNNATLLLKFPWDRGPRSTSRSTWRSACSAATSWGSPTPA